MTLHTYLAAHCPINTLPRASLLKSTSFLDCPSSPQLSRFPHAQLVCHSLPPPHHLNASLCPLACSEKSLPLSLVELPRLQLTFEARKGADGKVRLHSFEHPGLHVGWLPGEQLKSLLRGLPHALVLLNEEARH